MEHEKLYPKPSKIEATAEESLKLISTALEKLTVTQTTQAWSRPLKAPDVFKPEAPDHELRGWSDWKFSFCNYVRGIDPGLAAAMEVVEGELNADYALDDMTEETQGMAIRLYSLLTSYMRQRPLKLVRHMKQENGFVAWQTLLKEMQPATRARSLALLTQLSIKSSVCRRKDVERTTSTVRSYSG